MYYDILLDLARLGKKAQDAKLDDAEAVLRKALLEILPLSLSGNGPTWQQIAEEAIAACRITKEGLSSIACTEGDSIHAAILAVDKALTLASEKEKNEI